MNDYTTVIAAVSTPPGKGGVAIIRISGEGAIELAAKIFRPRSKKSLTQIPARVQVWGDIVYSGETIDDGMATCFYPPASYTGEEVVEISCHGGTLITATVLEAVLWAGARLAEAGEFTRRAFINGKISLNDAEAIGNLLDAETRDAARLSSITSRERLNERVADLRGRLTSILSSIYARIDYPDEDLGDFTEEETLALLEGIRTDASNLCKTYKTGKAISEGIKTVICGRPNVGKSSIYNLLLGEDAAIVTDVAGTTRDVLSEKLQLGKALLRLYDTAGIRSGEAIDTVEKIGIERSHRAIDDSELIIAVFDATSPLTGEDKALIEELTHHTAPKIAILNKCDRADVKICREELLCFDEIIYASALTDGEALIERLSAAVNALFIDERISVGTDAVIANARQNAALCRAIDFIDAAICGYKLGITQDAASSDVELALGAIAQLDGRAVSDEVVADIFAKFCVGK